jgi:enoyl reductase-like protein
MICFKCKPDVLNAYAERDAAIADRDQTQLGAEASTAEVGAKVAECDDRSAEYARLINAAAVREQAATDKAEEAIKARAEATETLFRFWPDHTDIVQTKGGGR